MPRFGPKPAAVAGLAVLLALALAPSAAARLPVTPAQADVRPNVVLLITDDQRLDDLRVMGSTLRLLGEHGTTFSQYVTTFPLCCPSRATMLTGQYAHNHKVLGNLPPRGGYVKLNGAETLPVWLERAGYRTAHVGRYLNGMGLRDPVEVPPGWTEWYGGVDPATYQYFDYKLNENGRVVDYTGRGLYQTDLLATKAEGFIGRASAVGGPFFLQVGFLAPHAGGPRGPDDPLSFQTPEPAPRHRGALAGAALPPSPAFNEADVSDKPVSLQALPPIPAGLAGRIDYNVRQRLETLLAVDEAVARVVGALEAAGELDDTLVMFTSDNGFLNGEHRVPREKQLLYEPSIRVPFLMRGPGVPAGRRSGDLVGNIDIVPTIVDATGAAPGLAMDGRSLLPLARDRTLADGRDILIERGQEGRNRSTVYAGLRTGRYVYAEYLDGERELYDLERDPDQLRSRHRDPAYTRLMGELHNRLFALRRCAGRSCRVEPGLALRLSYRRGARGCVRGGLVARVRGSGSRGMEAVRLYAGDRRVALDRRTPSSVRASQGRLRLRSGRRTRIRALVELRDGRSISLDRRVRGCQAS